MRTSPRMYVHVGKRLFLGKILSGKRPVGEMTRRGNVVSEKTSVGATSCRENVQKPFEISIIGRGQSKGVCLGCISPQIFSAPKWRNRILDANIFTGAKMVRTSSITKPNLVELGLHMLPGGDKVPCFLKFLLAASVKHMGQYFSYLGDFRFFAPQGRHIALMKAKFGVEESTFSRLFHAKFHHHL